ncbi:E3 ubiquitin-protein ligase PUB23 [Cajanus cajan]|uniref:U-box domain-containing protein n=1 Tax=Cajanus cajan TaxID=3821 RepID=A0A151R8W1_CAJCA|nr:E3 ubiquitin-protein ligase PUB23 [Cajanus cajan]KYP39064.1 U-box domain-containing protein 23 [Cajanus cajan]
MDETEIPTLFLCPISLQLMRDPVTVCTGITYDRENIERWLFSCNKNKTCPVTKQSLSHNDLTPNHTLQRVIQAWCTDNIGAQTILSPKSIIDQTEIFKPLFESKKFPEKQLKCLRMLEFIAFESESNKNCLNSAGAIDFLASTMMLNKSQGVSNSSAIMSEVALEVLFHLNPSESQLKNLMNKEGVQFVESLFEVLKLGKFRSRAHAAVLLKSAFEVAGPTQLSNVTSELFVEIVRVLRDQISQEASKAALKLLVRLCSWGRNRSKAVEGGAVLVLIELLLDVSERRTCELMLIALDRLCGCAEGRAELVNHGAGVAVVSKKILRVSQVGSDRGVKILTSISRHSATPRVLHEMLLFGAVSKLCLVLQVEGSFKAKERARETLKLHSTVWRHSTCIPIPLLASYP